MQIASTACLTTIDEKEAQVDTLKPHPFEAEVDNLLKSLEFDPSLAKQIVPNGILYFLHFSGRPAYVCLPSTLPNTYSNIVRIEVEIAELDEADAARLIYCACIHLNINDVTPARVAAKKSNGQKVKVLIQFVADLEALQPGFVASMLSHCCELADDLRREMVFEPHSKSA